ncbi:MAG: sulfite exporter TauE/SafE family protein [Planctomycetota bacterium]|nr:sulfite exporter TauE/SafE family protein [Planctomycetota bacterium]
MDLDIAQMALIAVVGVVAGTINTLVGGGTLLVLPLLIFLGIPPLVANGTNRVCVAIQAAVAGWTMSRTSRKEEAGPTVKNSPGPGWWPFLLVFISAIPGAWGAIEIDTLDTGLFKQVMGWMLLVAVGAFLFMKTPSRSMRSESSVSRIGFFSGCVLCGLYGGFMGAGIGAFVILLLTTALRIPIVDAVRWKVWMVMVISAAAGVWYLIHGIFDVETAIVLIPSYALGGIIGGRIVLQGGDRLLKPVVAITSAALALAILVGW